MLVVSGDVARPAIFFVVMTFLESAELTSPPHPVMKYCIIILTMFETTQYNARPLGNESVRKANIKGIIQTIS